MLQTPSDFKCGTPANRSATEPQLAAALSRPRYTDKHDVVSALFFLAQERVSVVDESLDDTCLACAACTFLARGEDGQAGILSHRADRTVGTHLERPD